MPLSTTNLVVPDDVFELIVSKSSLVDRSQFLHDGQ